MRCGRWVGAHRFFGFEILITDRFEAGERSAALHQRDGAGPFRWMHVPSVKIVEWNSTGERDYLHAICTTYDAASAVMVFPKSAYNAANKIG